MEKEQTKNQQENQKKSQKLQWHPTFCSALRLELLEDAANLEFTDEFQLTEKPLQIDCTVVKVKKNCRIKNEIGKIFRKYNIFEYKSPMDELNIDTFYKAIAYACLYKVLPNHVNEIPAEEITITLIRDRKPVKLMQELERSGYECKKETAGIYYIYSVMFPVQIIVSSELDTDMHVQLKALTDHLDETLMRQYLLEVSAFAEREKNLADVVLQVIVNSNMEKVEEWKGSEQTMCEALRVLMKEELKEERVAGLREGRLEGQREGQICAYATLVQDGIITVEIGAEKAGMSVDDFTKEMKKAGYVIPAV
ncbi:hypothetical protein ACTQ32_05270 [Roseburia faecis]|uniref:hypothetical protein n=1 Tax=Roseburia faecis TaxID=301302 RepID=UPI003F9BB72E